MVVVVDDDDDDSGLLNSVTKTGLPWDPDTNVTDIYKYDIYKAK